MQLGTSRYSTRNELRAPCNTSLTDLEPSADPSWDRYQTLPPWDRVCECNSKPIDSHCLSEAPKLLPLGKETLLLTWISGQAPDTAFTPDSKNDSFHFNPPTDQDKPQIPHSPQAMRNDSFHFHPPTDQIGHDDAPPSLPWQRAACEWNQPKALTLLTIVTTP